MEGIPCSIPTTTRRGRGRSLVTASAAWRSRTPTGRGRRSRTSRSSRGTAPCRSSSVNRTHDPLIGSVPMEYRLELVQVPVSDVDRAKAFYVDQVGSNADHDHQVTEELRFVQL